MTDRDLLRECRLAHCGDTFPCDRCQRIDAALSEPQEQPNAAPQKRDVEHVGAAGPARIGVPAGAAPGVGVSYEKTTCHWWCPMCQREVDWREGSNEISIGMAAGQGIHIPCKTKLELRDGSSTLPILSRDAVPGAGVSEEQDNEVTEALESVIVFLREIVERQPLVLRNHDVVAFILNELNPALIASRKWRHQLRAMMRLVEREESLRAQGGVWVPREIDRAKHGHVLLVWNDCMIKHETLEMTWPKLVEAMLAAAGGKE